MGSWNGTLGRFIAGFAALVAVWVGVVVFSMSERGRLLTDQSLVELSRSTRQTATALDLFLSAQERCLGELAAAPVLRGSEGRPEVGAVFEKALSDVPELERVGLFSADKLLLLQRSRRIDANAGARLEVMAPLGAAHPERQAPVRTEWSAAESKSDRNFSGPSDLVEPCSERACEDGRYLVGRFRVPNSLLPAGGASLFRYSIAKAPVPAELEVFSVLRKGHAQKSVRVGERELWLVGEFEVDAVLDVLTLPRRNVIFGLVGCITAIALVFGYLSRTVTRPLADAADAVEAMGTGDFNRKLLLSGPSEVRRLIASVNGLSDRLRQSYEHLVRDVEERSAAVVEALDKARALQKLSEDQANSLADKNWALEEQADQLRQQKEKLATQNEILALNNEQLARASRLKSEFLASMSHELRTPLNAVIGFSDLLLAGISGDLNAEQKEYLGDILSSGRHLLVLINDILDLSKIEAGKMPIACEPVDLRLPAREAEEMIRGLALKKQISLVFEGETEVICTGDAQRLRQVVLNLLSNAVKFTPPLGKVTLSVRADRFTRRAEIVVRDTGIGIKPADQEVIFEAFRQVESGHARHYEGTGLGLALVKKYVEAMGGTVRVESEPGQGAAFFVRLPLLVEREEAPELPSPTRVLVAEDDPANRQLLGNILRARGLDVMLVENGQQAVDALKRGLPSVLVLDLMMPLLDGFAVLEQLRRMPGGQGTGVLVLSARDLSADDRRVLVQAGAELVLKGSLPTEQFVSCVRRLAERPAVRGAA